jgi:alanine racemase
MNTYVAVNVSALRHNARQALQLLNPQSCLLAVVKANAYGHGLVLAARALVEAGAAWLGASTVAEGVALREAGLETPVLVFLPPCGSDEVEALVRHRLTGTLVAVSQLHGLATVCQAQSLTAMCHIYVDAGLSRLGGNDSLPDMLEALRAFPMVAATGIYTHFGPPGSGAMLEDLEFLRQGGAVKGFAGLAREAAMHVSGQRPLVHAAASRLFLEDQASHLDMVRLGTVLYGQYPDDCVSSPLQVREDTFALHSRLIAVQTVPAGTKVGYGGEFVCRRETRIATVPVGVAQGLEVVPKSMAGRPGTAVRAYLAHREGRRGTYRHAPKAHVGGREVPIVGRVSMDQCCLDVTDAPAAQIGSDVVLPTRRLMVSALVPRVAVEDQPGD